MRKSYKEYLKLKGYSQNTIETYVYSVSVFLDYFNDDVRKIEYADMLNFINSRGTKKKTINNNLSAIKNFMQFMKNYKGYEIKFEFDTLFNRKEEKVNREMASEATFQMFFEYLKEKEKHVQLAFDILKNTGIRISELVKIEKEDVITIDNRVFLSLEKTKGKEQRLAPVFCKKTAMDLIEHIESYIEKEIFYISIRGYQHYPLDFTEKTGVKFNLHMLRHQFATERIKEGMQIEILAKILGHKNINTTMLYIHQLEDKIIKLGAEI